jgi:hypothetical protein
MNYEEMSREELIKEIEKLNKKLNRKQVARLSWKKIMNGSIVKGPDYWSNGHFALYNNIEIPQPVLDLQMLDERTTDLTLTALLNEVSRHVAVLRVVGEGDEKGKILTEHDVKFTKHYIDMLDKLTPGYTLKVGGPSDAAIIELDGKMIGILMPTL